jgi:hypothetical protein
MEHTAAEAGLCQHRDANVKCAYISLVTADGDLERFLIVRASHLGGNIQETILTVEEKVSLASQHGF